MICWMFKWMCNHGLHDRSRVHHGESDLWKGTLKRDDRERCRVTTTYTTFFLVYTCYNTCSIFAGCYAFHSHTMPYTKASGWYAKIASTSFVRPGSFADGQETWQLSHGFLVGYSREKASGVIKHKWKSTVNEGVNEKIKYEMNINKWWKICIAMFDCQR